VARPVHTGAAVLAVVVAAFIGTVIVIVQTVVRGAARVKGGRR
jgi:hypothetical protein